MMKISKWRNRLLRVLKLNRFSNFITMPAICNTLKSHLINISTSSKRKTTTGSPLSDISPPISPIPISSSSPLKAPPLPAPPSVPPRDINYVPTLRDPMDKDPQFTVGWVLLQCAKNYMYDSLGQVSKFLGKFLRISHAHKLLFRQVKKTFVLVHPGYSFPTRQAQKLYFFTPCAYCLLHAFRLGCCSGC